MILQFFQKELQISERVQMVCFRSLSDAVNDRTGSGAIDGIDEFPGMLSEYPPGTRPQRYTFPRRNRIIAALSDDLYVIAAGKGSGTESTVKFANEYGRNVVISK